MGLFKKLNLPEVSSIDWEMTPEYTFGTFESWGGKERVRSKKERFYYFFIDAWGETPKLCLMERGIKHARVVAEILAPQEMIQRCVDNQGKVALYERTHGIDDELRQWLQKHVIDTDDDSKIIPLEPEEEEDILGPSGLPTVEEIDQEITTIHLPEGPEELVEEDVVQLIQTYDLVDHDRNPSGSFQGCLVDGGDAETVIDLVTGLRWQREGFDIMSHRMLRREVENLNKSGFAGYCDWRLPSLAEALSLMRQEKNSKDQYLHACFSAEQPFIFVDATRRPGGYWFVDYKHGRTFWASGTIPGGFGRLCRKEK